ncbi:hypothetical protein L484_012838 [Morus notabilis]|uniref:Uncharacterized protein n=1 Tax=Morus notabilis TaxID=981085 RepID=W9RH26_9ROSA|nr:hypothetical protein L484_012838 [Morus notabilis]
MYWWRRRGGWKADTDKKSRRRGIWGLEGIGYNVMLLEIYLNIAHANAIMHHMLYMAYESSVWNCVSYAPVDT